MKGVIFRSYWIFPNSIYEPEVGDRPPPISLE